jgi:hypothetical protein
MRLASQVAPNRATAYLHPTDVRDARAIWVNPAGLGVMNEASIYAEVDIGNPGAKGQLRQINAGLNARGLGFAYQRDIFDDGARGNTYRLALAGGSGALAVGFAVARYSGTGANDTGWDIGLNYGSPSLTVGGVFANISQPVVRGLKQPATFVPGATWHPSPLPALAVSTHARITTDSVASYGFGLSWQTGGGMGAGSQSGWPIAILARLDTDGDLRRGAFAFGLSVGGRDRIGVIGTTPGDVSSLDDASIYGVTKREAAGRR